MKKAVVKIVAFLSIAFFVAVPSGFAQVGTLDFRPSYTAQQITNQPANVPRPYYIQCPTGYVVNSIYLNVRRANAGTMGFAIYYPGGKTATSTISNTQTGYSFSLPAIPCLGGTASSPTSGIPIQLLGDQITAITEQSPFLGFPSTSTLAVIGTTTDRWLLAGLNLTLPLSLATTSSDMSSTTISQGLQTTNETLVAIGVVLAVIATLILVNQLKKTYYGI